MDSVPLSRGNWWYSNRDRLDVAYHWTSKNTQEAVAAFVGFLSLFYKKCFKGATAVSSTNSGQYSSLQAALLVLTCNILCGWVICTFVCLFILLWSVCERNSVFRKIHFIVLFFFPLVIVFCSSGIFCDILWVIDVEARATQFRTINTQQ